MIVCIISRTLFWAIIFAMLRQFGFVVLIVMFLLMLLVSLNDKKDIGLEKLVLGTITSLTAPCLILIEDTYYYIKSSIVGNILSLGIIWGLYFMATLKVQVLETMMGESKTVFECTNLTLDKDINEIIRCPSLNNASDYNCTEGFFAFSKPDFVTVCPPSYDRWWPLLMFCIVLSGIHLASMMLSFLMTYLMDPIHRYRLAKKLCCDTINLKEKDMFWKDLLDGLDSGPKVFKDINDMAINKLGHSLLTLSIQSEFIGLTEVT